MKSDEKRYETSDEESDKLHNIGKKLLAVFVVATLVACLVGYCTDRILKESSI